MENTTKWYHSPSMLFIVAAGFMAPTAFFSRIDDWYGIGKDLSHMFVDLGAVYVLNAGVYFSLQRGKYGALLLNWMNQLHFWLSLAPIVALIYYGHLTSVLIRTNYSNYPALRGRLSGAIQVAEVFVVLGGVVFTINIIQSAARRKRVRI
jgi:hypothetical protein